MKIDKEQLAYYERELQYLRKSGAEFARQHPKVASSLGLTPTSSSDPQVERLIESFAFLTSTLQRKYDDQFPTFSQTMLGVLYPQLVAPIPPMSIAQFDIDPSKGKSTTGQTIARGSNLYVQTDKGVPCRFQSCYDLTLWPLSVADVRITPAANYDFRDSFCPYPYVLRIRLKTQAKKLQEYDIRSLCFYIDADHFIANWMFECLFLENNTYATYNPAQESHRIMRGEEIVERVGFKEEEMVLPTYPQAPSSFNLIQEYFALPQKFMFFRLNQLDFSGCDDEVDLLIPMTSYDDSLKKNLQITTDSIKLGCTPVVNFFTHLTDPIDFNKRALFYPLTADVQKQRYMEIHTVEEVHQTIRGSKDVKKLSPYFSYDHGDVTNQQNYFYHLQQNPAIDSPGTKTEISFVDLGFNKQTPKHETIYAKVKCTNRDLAHSLRPGTRLYGEKPLPVSQVSLITQPTASIYNPGSGNYHWQLISQLTTDYVILGAKDNDVAVKVVKESINVFKRQVSHAMMTDGSDIMRFSTHDIVRRIGRDAWRGFLNGAAYHITFSEASYAKKDVMGFSAVLDHYFKNFSYTVSFTELSVFKPDEEKVWKVWPVQKI
ncbi:MAG: type VI secretion system baseplate subunit TssF [Alphaproteobacteria bacterium]|nr:MAG: type VI secretion system baseplate subunit TssF [Alphaproteobacteria bacterium]